MKRPAGSGSTITPVTTDLFDVGGYRLAAEVAGDGTNAVVFSSGLGDGSDPWDATIAALGPEFTSVRYARAGVDESDALEDRSPRSLGAAAEELRRLLAVVDVAPPYILVGHSIGALVALIYAARWPEQLAGLVLVDPTDTRLNVDLDKPELILDDGDRADCTSLDVAAGADDVEASRRQLDRPSVVISSRVGRWLDVDDPEPWRPFTLAEMDDRWQRAHHELAEDLGATRLIADVGDHYVHKDQPELVAQAIRGLAG